MEVNASVLISGIAIGISIFVLIIHFSRDIKWALTYTPVKTVDIFHTLDF